MTERRENIARALFDAANPIVAAWPDYWDRVSGGDETRDNYRRLADVAIAADDGAVGRVLALAEELDGEAEHSGPAKGAAYRISAARIRSAVGAPATAEDGDRG